MIQYKYILDNNLKGNICSMVLNSLPNWFGIEESTKDYINKSKDMLFYVAYDDKTPVGFVSIKENNPYTAEIFCMGVLEEYHNKKIGTTLLKYIHHHLRRNDFKFLMVKTLGPSYKDPYYKKTRDFYESIGFSPLEEIKEIWGENCPCLIMVKSLHHEENSL